jgi:hypothetical protein
MISRALFISTRNLLTSRRKLVGGSLEDSNINSRTRGVLTVHVLFVAPRASNSSARPSHAMTSRVSPLRPVSHDTYIPTHRPQRCSSQLPSCSTMANRRVAQRPACTLLGIQQALEDVLRRARGIIRNGRSPLTRATRSRPLDGTHTAVVHLP